MSEDAPRQALRQGGRFRSRPDAGDTHCGDRGLDPAQPIRTESTGRISTRAGTAALVLADIEPRSWWRYGFGAMPKAGATGNLIDWVDLDDAFEDASLLLGNGFSTHIWPGFGYDKLFAHADDLDERDLALFEALDTSNFESALEVLATSLTVAEVFDLADGDLVESYERIQTALGNAVRAVHVEWKAVHGDSLDAIQQQLLEHSAVFTTSYDLLVYWAMAREDGFDALGDGFWGNPLCHSAGRGTLEWMGKIPVYYLHGALHLVARSDGRVGKHRRSLRNVLDKFGTPLPDDPRGRPLLVTEGSSRHKLRVIESNEYLTFCREALVCCSSPIVSYGFSFGEQDRHIAEAINQHRDRPVAVSMRGAGRSKSDLKSRQSIVQAVLHVDELYFYDAATHPLGQVPRAVE